MCAVQMGGGAVQVRGEVGQQVKPGSGLHRAWWTGRRAREEGARGGKEEGERREERHRHEDENLERMRNQRCSAKKECGAYRSVRNMLRGRKGRLRGRSEVRSCS